MKKVKEIILWIMMIYLIVSALYVLFHINFFEEPEINGMGFSESNNVLRLFMGLTKTYSTYEGVGPIFLIEVIIKIVLAIFILRYLKNKERKDEK